MTHEVDIVDLGFMPASTATEFEAVADEGGPAVSPSAPSGFMPEAPDQQVRVTVSPVRMPSAPGGILTPASAGGIVPLKPGGKLLQPRARKTVRRRTVMVAATTAGCAALGICGWATTTPVPQPLVRPTMTEGQAVEAIRRQALELDAVNQLRLEAAERQAAEAKAEAAAAHKALLKAKASWWPW